MRTRGQAASRASRPLCRSAHLVDGQYSLQCEPRRSADRTPARIFRDRCTTVKLGFWCIAIVPARIAADRSPPSHAIAVLTRDELYPLMVNDKVAIATDAIDLRRMLDPLGLMNPGGEKCCVNDSTVGRNLALTDLKPISRMPMAPPGHRRFAESQAARNMTRTMETIRRQIIALRRRTRSRTRDDMSRDRDASCRYGGPTDADGHEPRNSRLVPRVGGGGGSLLRLAVDPTHQKTIAFRPLAIRDAGRSDWLRTQAASRNDWLVRPPGKRAR